MRLWAIKDKMEFIDIEYEYYVAQFKLVRDWM